MFVSIAFESKRERLSLESSRTGIQGTNASCHFLARVFLRRPEEETIMASRASTVLLVLGLLAASRSYEVTMLEDVIGEYDFRMFKDLFVNTTKQLTQSISQLQKNAAKSNTLKELMDAVEELNESLATLTEHTTSVRDSVNNAADSTTTELQRFQNQVLHKLSDVKLLVESKTKEMEDTVSRFTRLSHNLMAGDCQDLYDMGFNASGVYFLQKFGRQVLCDMESGDGGWLVIQRRAKVVEQVRLRDKHLLHSRIRICERYVCNTSVYLSFSLARYKT